MSSSPTKCKDCGSTAIEYNDELAERVCTNCGTVLSTDGIVSAVQFIETGKNGKSRVIGQFVATEPYRVTLHKARVAITRLCTQFNLSELQVNIACNFHKMAYHKSWTRGRKCAHVYAACVYLMCRTEGVPLLLIDISDNLQICCYTLGRMYLRLKQLLCINPQDLDPCLYIMKFARKLELGEKLRDVSHTAQRLVRRMMKDSIHIGRLPSGVSGAALLIASRMHDLNRMPEDIVKIVKVHESTLRKRLLDFGNTASGNLLVSDFMEHEHLMPDEDPPSFKVATIRDEARILALPDVEAELSELQKEIETALGHNSETRWTKKSMRKLFTEEENSFRTEFVDPKLFEVIAKCTEEPDNEEKLEETCSKIGVERDFLEKLCSPTVSISEEQPVSENLDLEDIDDEELDGYILSQSEAELKTTMWTKLNTEYLAIEKERKERLAKAPPKNPRKRRRLNAQEFKNADEAVGSMLKHKKLSSKINYDCLQMCRETSRDVTEVRETQITKTSKVKVPTSIQISCMIKTAEPEVVNGESGAGESEEDSEDEEDTEELTTLGALFDADEDHYGDDYY